MSGDPILVPTEGATQLSLDSMAALALGLECGFEFHEPKDLWSTVKGAEIDRHWEPQRRVVLWWLEYHVHDVAKVRIMSDRQGYYGQDGRVRLSGRNLALLVTGRRD